MTSFEVEACPLCSGHAVRVPLKNVDGYEYACRECRGLFMIGPDAITRAREGGFERGVADAARAIFANGGRARIELACGGVTITRLAPHDPYGDGQGRGAAYCDGQVARLTGLSDAHNPKGTGNKDALDWYDGWASMGGSMRDTRLPPRPEPLPVVAPDVFTLRRLIPLFAGIGLLLICVRLARHDAEQGYDLGLFMQCMCIWVDACAVFAMARAMWLDCRTWRSVRSRYDGMLDELEGIALTHLRMLDDGIEAPEAVDRKFTEFAGRFDARIREAFRVAERGRAEE